MERLAALTELGRALRALRGERQLSQEALADRCDLHRTYIGGIERGERNPSYLSLLRIADGLDVSLARWVEHASPQDPEQ